MKIHQAVLATIALYLLLIFSGAWIWLVPAEQLDYRLTELSRIIHTTICFVIVIMVFYFYRRYGLLRFRHVGIKWYAIAVFLGALFVLLHDVLNIMYYFKLPDTLSYRFSLQGIQPYHLIASVFIAPVYEELFFRNLLQKGLTRKYGPVLGIGLAALLFAFVHINALALYIGPENLHLHRAYIAFFGGLISGILFHRSHSVCTSILFHASWNLFSFVL